MVGCRSGRHDPRLTPSVAGRTRRGRARSTVVPARQRARRNRRPLGQLTTSRRADPSGLCSRTMGSRFALEPALLALVEADRASRSSSTETLSVTVKFTRPIADLEAAGFAPGRSSGIRAIDRRSPPGRCHATDSVTSPTRPASCTSKGHDRNASSSITPFPRSRPTRSSPLARTMIVVSQARLPFRLPLRS